MYNTFFIECDIGELNGGKGNAMSTEKKIMSITYKIYYIIK